MTQEIKISDLNGAPNLALGWATSAIGVRDSDCTANYHFNADIKSLVVSFNNTLDGEAFTSNTLNEILEFYKTIGEYEHILFYSRNGRTRAETLAYVFYMYKGASPGAAIYELQSLAGDVVLDTSIIALAEKALNLGTKHSQFIRIWQTEKQTK